MNNFAAANKTPGLYIHIPVCISKCNYCGFYSRAGVTKHRLNRLIGCICQEIIRSSDYWSHFDTIYLGGGTPSLLDPHQLKNIMESVRNRFSIPDHAEITLEANPGDVTAKMIDSWIACGINRISLGVQSLDDKVLHFLGRRHNREEALRALDLLWNTKSCVSPGRNSGIDDPVTGRKGAFASSVDLILGVPDQSPESYRRTLSEILKFRPDHISCYQLTVEPGTPLETMVRAGELTPLDSDLESEFFRLTHRELTGCGFYQYEVSNYAADINSIARHNSKYWLDVPYLGIGPSAHSYDRLHRWANILDLDKYCRSIEAGTSACDFIEDIDSHTRAIEQIMLGVRTCWGFDPQLLSPGTCNPDIVEKLMNSGFLQKSQGRLRPTPEGMEMADSIAEMLIRCRDA